jgi:hypothetical protein
MAEGKSEDVQALDICPNCFTALSPDDPVCGKCGFDTLAGQGLPPSEVEADSDQGSSSEG